MNIKAHAKNGSRIIRYDYARVLCMIWVVGILHMSHYINHPVEVF